MSSLPLLSHHLFVAAVTNKPSQRKAQRPRPSTAGKVKTLALEVLTGQEARELDPSYPLRATVSAGAN